jgi:hypothetical protein
MGAQKDGKAPSKELGIVLNRMNDETCSTTMKNRSFCDKIRHREKLNGQHTGR